jgi:hypothetical protein
MRSRRFNFAIFILSIVGLFASPSFAWNSIGHEIVSLIAYDQMPPAARTKICAALKNHPRVNEDLLNDQKKFTDADIAVFIRASTWPDLVRYPANPMNRTEHHGPWHYVDFPFNQDGVKGPEPVTEWDGHSNPENLIQAMQKCLAELKDTKTPPNRKALDLCWVEHLVGDIHQPLHAVSWYSKEFPKGDQGGNQVMIRGADNIPINLHTYWDGIEGMVLEPDPIRKSASRIEAEHPPDKLAQQTKDLNIVDWAHESFELARTVVYEDGTLPHTTRTLGASRPSEVPPRQPDYDQRAKDTADLRIAEAGYRLAAVLEDVAKGLDTK